MLPSQRAIESMIGLVYGLNEATRRSRGLLMLQCFVDESGNGQGPVMVMAGVVSDVGSWASFSDEWQECLDMRPAMKALHMRDVAQSWGGETQDRISRFRKIFCDHVKASVVISVPLEDYRDIFGSEKPWNNPYIFMFFVLIRAYKLHHNEIGLSRDVDFIFDEQMGAMAKIAEAWEFFRGGTPELLDFVGGMPSFKDDEKVLPLQAADLLAWWVRRQVAADMTGDDRLLPPWSGTDAVPCIRLSYDREGLARERLQMMGAPASILA